MNSDQIKILLIRSLGSRIEQPLPAALPRAASRPPRPARPLALPVLLSEKQYANDFIAKGYELEPTYAAFVTGTYPLVITPILTRTNTKL